LSYNNIKVLGDQFERMINLHSLNLTGNSELDVDGLPIRTRRLHEKQQLLRSKSERRALIQRALGIRNNVLQKEQSMIMEAQSLPGNNFP